MAAETRGLCQDFMVRVQTVSHSYYNDLSERSRGCEEYICQAIHQMLAGHHVTSGIANWQPLQAASAPTPLELRRVELDLSRLPWHVAGDGNVVSRQASASAPAVFERAASFPCAPISPLPSALDREDFCESPSKKARGISGPVASPCRNGPVGRAASGLGPVPKDPPPRSLAEESEHRELSSPKKRLRDRPGNSPSPCAADARPAWQTKHQALFAPALAKCPPGRRPHEAGGLQSFGSTARSGAADTPSGVADMVKRIEGSVPTQSTPVSVLERCRLFENPPRSTPGSRPPSSAAAPLPSPAACASGLSNAAAVSNSQPLTQTSIRPKALFSCHADAPQRGNSGAPSLKGQSQQQAVLPRTGCLKEPSSGSLGGYSTSAPANTSALLKHTADSLPSSLRNASAPAHGQLKHASSTSSLRTGSAPFAAHPQAQLKHASSTSSLKNGSAPALAPSQLKHADSTNSLRNGSAPARAPSPLSNLRADGAPARAASPVRSIRSGPAQQLKHTASSSSLRAGEVPAPAKQSASNSSLGALTASGKSLAATQEREAVADLTPASNAAAGEGGAAAAKRKGNRRSACLYAAEAEVSSTAQGAAEAASASAPAAASSSAPAGQLGSEQAAGQRGVRPPVPLFSESSEPVPQRLEPYFELRQMNLPEKRLEDNYEISETGGNSDAEESHSKDRSSKHVPKWCSEYLGELTKQCDIDPDTIFGHKVPQCNLEEIFNNEMYRQAGKNRPKRQRGSSGDWRKDRLTRTEIIHYKSRMGHMRAWSTERQQPAQ